MPSSNPTQTRGIEKRWRKEINRRFLRFSISIQAELARMNAASLEVRNVEIGIDATQARIYVTFVKQQITDILLGTTAPPNWQARYQLEAYQKSLEKFSAAMRAQGEDILASRFEAEIAATLAPFTATPALGTALGVGLQAPVHREALEFLFTRSYESLEGWTNKLAAEVRQITFDGIAEGQSFQEVSKAIRLRTSVTRSRANLIAQTEVNQAFGVAQTTQAERTEEITGRPVGLRWLTTLKSNVRHLHAGWHGTVSSPSETRRRKGVSPYNCHCGLSPVIEGANTPAKQEKFKKERVQLIEREKAVNA